ncbi:MAG: DUF1194 domain-containing protein [Janthinobacterium lividum]
MRAIVLLLLLLAGPAPAAEQAAEPTANLGANLAAEPVDLALVLLSDVSRSVDDAEFRLQKAGYAAAFGDPRVLAAIRNGAIGRIAVAYVEFAGSFEVRTVTDWRIVRDADSARAMTAAIEAAPRSFWGRTSISAGIDHAVQLLAAAPLEAQRRVIDVAGDGTNNAGRPAEAARDDAVRAGITVNGLAIINEHPVSYTFAHVQPPGGLTEWYRQNVSGGPGAFVLEVREFSQFGEAMTRKLINEIAGLPHPAAGPATGAAAGPATRPNARPGRHAVVHPRPHPNWATPNWARRSWAHLNWAHPGWEPPNWNPPPRSPADPSPADPSPAGRNPADPYPSSRAPL